MDIKKLARISDSFHSEGAKELKKKKEDSRKKFAKKRIRMKLMDTESTEDAVSVAVNALQDEEPEVVLTAVVETLGDVVTSLEETVEAADSKKVRHPQMPRKQDKKSSAFKKARLKKKLMDTESTEDVIAEAKSALEIMPPADVVETVIEVLDDVISNISAEPAE